MLPLLRKQVSGKSFTRHFPPQLRTTNLAVADVCSTGFSRNPARRLELKAGAIRRFISTQL